MPFVTSQPPMHSISGFALAAGVLVAVGAVGELHAAAAVSSATASTKRERRVIGVSPLEEPHSYERR